MGGINTLQMSSVDEFVWSRVVVQFAHSAWDHQEPTTVEFTLNRPNPIIVGMNGVGKSTLLRALYNFFSIVGGFKFPSDEEQKRFIQSCRESGIAFLSIDIEFPIHHTTENLGAYVDDLQTLRFQSADSEDNMAEKLANKEVYQTLSESLSNAEYGLSIDPGYSKEYPRKFSFEEYLKFLEEDEFIGAFSENLYDDTYEQIVSAHLKHVFDFKESVFKSSSTIDFTNSYRCYEYPQLDSRQDETYHWEDNSNAFGNKDFHSLVIDAIGHFEKQLGYSINYSEKQLFPVPHFNPVLIDTESIVVSQVNERALDIIDGDDIDVYMLESFLDQMSDNQVLELLGARLNDRPMRSLKEWPRNPSAGSWEEFDSEYSTREISTVEPWDFERSDHDLKAPFYMQKTGMKFDSAKYEDNLNGWDSVGVDYHKTGTVWCVSIESMKKMPNHLRHNPKSAMIDWMMSDVDLKVIRLFGDVILNKGRGIVYSERREPLSEFIRSYLFRFIETEDKCWVLSKLFDVDLNDLTALYQVKQMGPKISTHLTSGQKRLYTLFKTISDTKKNIILIDEPEVSMHIDWQRKIVDLIRKSCKSNMVLIATHSPDVIYHHHGDVIDLGAEDQVA